MKTILWMKEMELSFICPPSLHRALFILESFYEWRKRMEAIYECRTGGMQGLPPPPIDYFSFMEVIVQLLWMEEREEKCEHSWLVHMTGSSADFKYNSWHQHNGHYRHYRLNVSTVPFAIFFKVYRNFYFDGTVLCKKKKVNKKEDTRGCHW